MSGRVLGLRIQDFGAGLGAEDLGRGASVRNSPC